VRIVLDTNVVLSALLWRGRITVETVAWDKPGAGTPMLATLTPQEAIKQSLPVSRSG
jgi:hypothetical protein